MQSKFIEGKIKYDGAQLAGQYAYLEHGLMGPSIVAFRGPCDVTIQNMADGEDLLAGESICGSDMLHFLVEVFDWSMTGAVALQRLLAASVGEELQGHLGSKKGASSTLQITRRGDDLYWGAGKLSISVAAKSPLGAVIHFAINISNKGTPVKTAALCDLNIESESQVLAFAKNVLKKFQSEYASLIDATYKVKPVGTWNSHKSLKTSKTSRK